METAFHIVVLAGGIGGFAIGLWLTMKLEPKSIYAGIGPWRTALGYILPFAGMVVGIVATYEMLRWLG